MDRVYNKVFDPQIWAQVNPLNKELLDDFLLGLRENKRSPGTIRQYTSDLRGFFCYLFNAFDNISVLNLSRKDLKRYAISLVEERYLSNARRNGLISSLHSLLDYAEADEDYEYENNTSRQIKSLAHEPVKEIVFLDDETVMRMFDQLTLAGRLQMAALLMLSYDSAGRRNELAQVTKEGFLDPTRNNTNIVIGKRRKKFSMLYFDVTRRAVLVWLEKRGDDDISTLFIEDWDGNKRAAESHDIYEMFCAMRSFLVELGGVEADFGPHSMRHSALTNYKDGTHHVCREMGRGGFSLDQLQILAHHDSIETTQGYLPDITNQELEGMFNIQIRS
jgi:integrase